MNGYAVVFERGGDGEEAWGAYVPDLPGCVSTGDSLEEVKLHIREAIQLHLDGLREEGLPIPPPTSRVEQIAIAA